MTISSTTPLSLHVEPSLDVFETSLDIPQSKIYLQLITRYISGREHYWLCFEPNPEITSKEIGSMVTQVLPGYPNCPVEKVEEEYVAKRTLFRQAPPSTVNTSEKVLSAARFVLASRIVKAYNEDFAKVVALKMEDIVRNFQITVEAIGNIRSMGGRDFIPIKDPGFFSGLLSASFQSITDNCKEYLHTIPRNPFSLKVEETIGKVALIFSKIKSQHDIAGDLLELQKFLPSCLTSGVA